MNRNREMDLSSELPEQRDEAEHDKERERFADFYQRELEGLASEVRRMFGGAASRPDYTRQLGSAFSESGLPIDPHVKRLVDSFAFLTARISKRLDDDLPELSGGLLEMLQPQLLAPMPAACMVAFEATDTPRNGHVIERGTALTLRPAHDPAAGRCEFRTTSPVELWPISIESAEVGAIGEVLGRDRDAILDKLTEAAAPRAVLRLRLSCRSGSFAALTGCDTLRFYLHGAAQFDLYGLLLGRPGCSGVFARGAAGVTPLTLLPFGLSPLDALSIDGEGSADERVFHGYRLLREYFAFPQKFLSFTLHGLAEARRLADADLEVLFLLAAEPPRKRLDRDSFLLACAPAVNLFRQEARSQYDDHTRSELLIEPETPSEQDCRIFSIDEVRCLREELGSDGLAQRRPLSAAPFYSPRPDAQVRWHARRKGDRMYLSLVDRSLQPASRVRDVLDVTLTCMSSVPRIKSLIGTPRCEPLGQSVPRSVRLRCRQPPGQSPAAPSPGREYWQLLSLLTLGQQSLLQDDGAPLRALLQLFARDRDPQIACLRSVQHDSRLRPMSGAFCRGLEVRLQLDTLRWPAEQSPVLLGIVLGRCLAQAVSINSFIELVLVNQDGQEVLRCAPQSGETRLL